MRLLQYTVHNVKRITDVTIAADGANLVLVGGKNGAGKSSAIDALLMAICGKTKTEWPDVPIRDGETVAEVPVSLGGIPGDLGIDTKTLTVVRRWEQSRGKIVDSLKILDEDGDEAATPQKILDELFRNRALDPMSLEQMSKADRRRLLMDAVGVTDVYEETQAAHESAYKERTVVNRDGKALAALVAGMPTHSDAPDADVVVSELLVELEHAKDVNKQLEDYRAAVADVELARTRLEKAEALVAELFTSESARDESVILGQIAAAEGMNKKRADNAAKKAKEAELDALRAKSASLSAEIERHKMRQESAISSAAWPVEGLAVDSEGLLLNGIPVEQCSTSERIKLWTYLSAAMNPELRLLVIKDGNDLDLDSLRELDTFLQANDFQAIVEFVVRGKEDEDRCAVVIRDGSLQE